MTTASTLACTVLLPLNLYIYVDCIYGSEVDIDWSQLLLSVVVVVTAVGVGLFASYSLPSPGQQSTGAEPSTGLTSVQQNSGPPNARCFDS